MTMHITALALAIVVAGPVAAQQKQEHKAPQQQGASIDPGMSRAQVVERLGQPLSSRSFESFTYLLYRNGCERKCGMNDLVVLDSGKVVDAVFRAPGRKYTGASSSPKMIDADAAKRGADVPVKPAAQPAAQPAAKAPVEVSTPPKKKPT